MSCTESNKNMKLNHIEFTKAKKKKSKPCWVEVKTICNAWWSRKLWVLLVHYMVMWIILSFWLHTTSREYHLGSGFWRKKMWISCLALLWKASFTLWTSFSVAFYHSLSLPSLTLSPLSCFPHFFSSYALSVCPRTPLSLPFVLAMCCLGNNNSLILFFHFSFMNLSGSEPVCVQPFHLGADFKRKKNNTLIFNN